VKTCTSRFVILFLLITIFFRTLRAQQRIADTIFYNGQWQICEQPIASFYRVGELVVDSFWYYRGAVKDYTITDTLLMEGEYDKDGFRQGNFRFYYSNGELYLLSRYERDLPKGIWQWWYASGKEKAQINFNGDFENFQFLTYKDDADNTLLVNGTGSFVWNANPFAFGIRYRVQGAFEQGKRSGKWIFSNLDGRDRSVDFTEVYGKAGELKNIQPSGSFRGVLTAYPFSFITPRLKVMENISFDPIFRRAGDSLAVLALYSYLMDKRSLRLRVKQSAFDSASQEMVKTLDSYRGKFNYINQDLDGKIEFRLGAKGVLEDISITGVVDSTSQKFMGFLMEKFTNIDMPGTSEVAIESYHTIYFYTINIKDYFPASMRGYVDKDFFITTIPKNQMIALMNAQKKNIKKYIRKLLMF
jgi:antitoxin component YwqK of YwqJK toxin-antitoxin module